MHALTKLEKLCLTDTAMHVGGASIYWIYPFIDFGWSRQTKETC